MSGYEQAGNMALNKGVWDGCTQSGYKLQVFDSHGGLSP